MKKISVSGKSIGEAVEAGLKQLNTTEDRVRISVLEEPAKGLFGLIGSKEATIEMELIPDAVEESKQFLQRLLQAMGVEASVDVEQDEETTVLQISGPELGKVIGRRGQTLDALQYLVSIVGNRFSNERFRIILDAENFRSRRKATLEQLAERLANKVRKTRREVMLEPMSPQDRKVIHSILQHAADVVTYSKGNEPNRRIVIDIKRDA